MAEHLSSICACKLILTKPIVTEGVSMNFFFKFLVIMLQVIFSQSVRNPFSASDIYLLGQTLDRNPNSFSHTTLVYHDYVPSPPSPPTLELQMPLPPPSPKAKRGSCRPALLPPPSEIKKRRMLEYGVKSERPPAPNPPDCRDSGCSIHN